MISILGWMLILFVLIISSVLINAVNDYDIYKYNECHKRIQCECWKCKKKYCPYRDKIVDRL